METQAKFFVFLMIFGLSMLIQCSESAGPPDASATDARPRSSSEIDDQGPGAIELLKRQLKERIIFDPDTTHRSRSQQKQIDQLFDAVGLMLSARVRQPESAQNAFVPLRTLQRALEKQLKDGLISRSLYNEFRWDRLNSQESQAKQ